MAPVQKKKDGPNGFSPMGPQFKRSNAGTLGRYTGREQDCEPGEKHDTLI